MLQVPWVYAGLEPAHPGDAVPWGRWVPGAGPGPAAARCPGAARGNAGPAVGTGPLRRPGTARPAPPGPARRHAAAAAEPGEAPGRGSRRRRRPRREQVVLGRALGGPGHRPLRAAAWGDLRQPVAGDGWERGKSAATQRVFAIRGLAERE